MTTFVAVSSLDTPPLTLRSDLDVMSATLEAASRVQAPVSDQDPRGTTYEISWWLAEDGSGRVATYRLTPMGHGTLRKRVETFTVRESRAEVPFVVIPPRTAQNRAAAAAGAFWTDGSVTVCVVPTGEVVRLSGQRAITRFAVAAAKAGFVIQKVNTDG